MNHDILYLIGGLAVATYAIRVLGLVTGNMIQRSRFAWVLDELPGLLIVALVASSLSSITQVGWLAAAITLMIAIYTNNVVLTMIGGVITFAMVSNLL